MSMKVGELVAILTALPQDLEVIVSSQGETVQVPIEAKVEAVCEEDEDGNGKDIVRLYTDNGEQN